MSGSCHFWCIIWYKTFFSFFLFFFFIDWIIIVVKPFSWRELKCAKQVTYRTENTTTNTRRINPRFFAVQIQIQITNRYLGCGCKNLVFCRNNGWIMEKMDKGLTVPKWVLIVWPKIPQMSQNLYAQFVCLSPKVLNVNEKRLHRASLISGFQRKVHGSLR